MVKTRRASSELGGLELQDRLRGPSRCADERDRHRRCCGRPRVAPIPRVRCHQLKRECIGNRYREVLQLREGLRFHFARAGRRRLRPLLEHPGRRLQVPRRGPACRVRCCARAEGGGSAERSRSLAFRTSPSIRVAGLSGGSFAFVRSAVGEDGLNATALRVALEPDGDLAFVAKRRLQVRALSRLQARRGASSSSLARRTSGLVSPVATNHSCSTV